jgi:5-methylcytosine-specific restriction protein A
MFRPPGWRPPEERKREQDRRRGSQRERGYTRQWAKARLQFLKEHPLCAECLRNERVTEATVVDHITPHRGDMNLFWNRNNWQPLCASCHGRKTAKEDGGFGNRGRGE